MTRLLLDKRARMVLLVLVSSGCSKPEKETVESKPTQVVGEQDQGLSFTVDIEGSGVVYVNDKLTEGQRSTLNLKPGSVRLKAVPAEGFAFQAWFGSVKADNQAETATFELTGTDGVSVMFVERPGAQQLDLLSDLKFFLQAAKQASDIDNFDINKIKYDVDTRERIYTGNGLPDAVELFLVQYVLKNAQIDWSSRSGITADEAWAVWNKNLERARSDLDALDERIIRVVAAYMTVGDFDTQESIANLVKTSLGKDLVASVYDNSCAIYLAAQEDADNDGTVNFEEWQKASPDNSITADPLTRFAQLAYDGGEPQ